MRAVFINHCHPKVDHVCGLRADRFAKAMAANGHKIVLLTQTLHENDDSFPTEELKDRLARHDWRQPFQVSCPPRGNFAAIRARQGKIVSGFRHLVILWSFIRYGGMFPDWQAGATPYLASLAEAFKPEVVWGTFGNTDTWRLCQKLATLSHCHWVGDFKDNWLGSIPIGLKKLIAGYFKDLAAMTVFSINHRDQADFTFPKMQKKVLYSGIDMFDCVPMLENSKDLKLVLTGSIYYQDKLKSLLRAVQMWAQNHPNKNVLVHYAGNDGKLVQICAEQLRYEVKIEGFLKTAELQHLQSNAAANLYIYNPRCLLHHKTLELIAHRRPVVAFPEETREAKHLAEEAGCTLITCEEAEALVDTLDIITDTPPGPSKTAGLASFSWQERVQVLETVLKQVSPKALQHP